MVQKEHITLGARIQIDLKSMKLIANLLYIMLYLIQPPNNFKNTHKTLP